MKPSEFKSILAAVALIVSLAGCAEESTETGSTAVDVGGETKGAETGGGDSGNADAVGMDADGTDGTDGTTGGGIPVVDEPTIEPPPVGTELPAVVVRGFQCTPAGVGEWLTVAKVQGTETDVIGIRPKDGPQCQYDVLYRAKDGTEYPLSSTLSGYLFTVARRDGAQRIVCISDLQHSDAGSGQRQIDRVVIHCAAHTGADWIPLVEVVAPDGEWAAWVRTVEPTEVSGRYVLRYARDFTYQVMNLTDNGRPPTDGIYEVELQVGSETITVGPAVKVSDKTHPATTVDSFQKWEPSDSDKDDYSEFIDFSDGPCPQGCPIEDDASSSPQR